ncbi:MAG: hypothetical protein K6A73_03785 [Bacteroidales bacterium]|nr:hypothetical protein [Bacteroidales bacterium]
MEKNIIICWNKDSAQSIGNMAKKSYLETQDRINSILRTRSELRVEIEKIIKDGGELDSSRICQIPDNLKDDLYKKVYNDFGNINYGFTREEKVQKLIEIIDKRELEYNQAKADVICLYNLVCSCTCFKDLKEVITSGTRIDGFIVLCDLDWSDYDSTDDYKGISLVQHFIRYEMKITAPVVFTSTKTLHKILDSRPDANIITTPALQQKFKQFSLTIEDLLHCFDNMKEMTKRQLEYTLNRFCDLQGLLSHIKHNCSNDSLDSCKIQLLYAVKKLFNDDNVKVNEIKAASSDKEIVEICEKYIHELQNDNTATNIRVVDFIGDSEEKQLRTLILDDNEQDSYTNRLVQYMNQIYNEVSSNNLTCSIAKPVVTRNTDEFFDMLDKYSFNNIILDVEIWNKTGELVALGFDIAEEVRTRMSTPVQINMITNITRTLHSKLIDSYNNDVIKGIYLKEEILSSDSRTIKFIHNLNQEWNKYYYSYKTPQYDCCKAFQRLLSIAKRRMPDNVKYDIDFNIISDVGKTDMKTYTITNYDELDKTVNDISTALIRRFLTECGHTTTNDITWPIFDTVCATMRKVIADKNSIGLGNETLTDKVMSKGKYKNMVYEPAAEDIINFAIKLALRRFFLYLKLFIHKYDILRKFNDIKKKDQNREDFKWRYQDADLACRAICEQHRGFLNKEFIINNQSKGLTAVLLYSIRIKDEKEQLSEDEKAFVEAVIKNKNSFNYKMSINNLVFEY